MAEDKESEENLKRIKQQTDAINKSNAAANKLLTTNKEITAEIDTQIDGLSSITTEIQTQIGGLSSITGINREISVEIQRQVNGLSSITNEINTQNNSLSSNTGEIENQNRETDRLLRNIEDLTRTTQNLNSETEETPEIIAGATVNMNGLTAAALEFLNTLIDINEHPINLISQIEEFNSISRILNDNAKVSAKTAANWQRLASSTKNAMISEFQSGAMTAYTAGLKLQAGIEEEMTKRRAAGGGEDDKTLDILQAQSDLTNELNSDYLSSAKSLASVQEKIKGITGLQQTLNKITDLHTSQKAELNARFNLSNDSIKKQLTITDETTENGKLLIEQQETLTAGHKRALEELEKAHEIQTGLAKNADIMVKKEARLNSILESNKTIYEAMPESLRSTVDFGKQLVTTMKSAGVAAGGWMLLAGVLISAISAFVNLQEAAKDFRNETGLTVSQTRELDTQANSIVMRFAGIGVEAKDVYGTVSALKSEFADFVDFSEESVSTLVLMNKNFGVSFDSAAKVQGIFENIGGLSSDTAASLQMQVVNMAKGAKVAPAKVMADIAENAEAASTFFKGDTTALTKNAIQARLMGSSLKEQVELAEKLLDFEGSIEDELIAATFVHGQFNLSKARALAFEGETALAAEETLRQIQRSGDFTKQDIFTKKALAKAAGMTVEQITKQLAIQDKLSNLSTVEKEEIQKALDAGFDITDVNKEQIKQELEKFKLQREQQGELDNIKNQFMGIAVTLGSILVPLLKLITPILQIIADGVGHISDAFIWVFDSIKGVFDLFPDLNLGIGKTISQVLGVVAAIGLGVTAAAYLASKFVAMWKTISSIQLIEKVRLGYHKLIAFWKSKQTVEDTAQAAAATRRAAADRISSLPRRQNVIPPTTGRPVPPVSTGTSPRGGGMLDRLMKIKTQDMLRGAASILVLSAAMYVAAKAFKEFEDVDWEDIGKGVTGMTGLSVAVAILGQAKKHVMKGAAAIVILSGAMYIAANAFKEFNGIDWKSVIIGTRVLIGLSIAAAVMGQPAFALAILTGAGLLAVLGAALIPFGIALKLAAPGISAFGEVITSVGGVITSILEGIPPILKATVEGIQSLMGSITPQSLLSLYALGPALLVASAGIIVFGGALAFFSISARIGGTDISTTLDSMGKMFISFGQSLAIASPFVSAIGDVITSVGNIIVSILGQLPPIITATSDGLINLMKSVTPEGVSSLFKLGPALALASVGMGLFAISVTALSVASKLGGNIIDSLSGLGSLTEKLPLINEQLTGMGGILSQLGEYIGPVDMLATSLNNLAESLTKVGTISTVGGIFSRILGISSPLGMLSDMAKNLPIGQNREINNNITQKVQPVPEPMVMERQTKIEPLPDIKIEKNITQPETIQSDTGLLTPLGVLINEVKMLRQDMANGKIAVYMDTEKVTSKIARQVDISSKNYSNLTRT